VQQQAPDQPHTIEYIDGLGSMLAAVAAAVGLFIAIWQAKQARADANKQLEEERQLAEDRLLDERAAATQQLQMQLDHMADQQRRETLVEIIQRATDTYLVPSSRLLSTDDNRRIKMLLHAVPGRYLSLMKHEFRTAETPESVEEAERRLASAGDPPSGRSGLPDDLIFQEVADNLDDLLQQRTGQLDTTPVDNS
jgi:signal transduction histidine kinase